jgi:hypothetical protein
VRLSHGTRERGGEDGADRVDPVPRRNDKVTEYIDSLPAPQRDICESLRELILRNFQQLREEFKYNYPAYYFERQRICSIGGFKRHANLELDYGAHLRDSRGRIEGVGKNIRHIKIRSLEEIDEEHFVELLQQSLDHHAGG